MKKLLLILTFVRKLIMFRYLIILFLLFPLTSYSKTGDVYYCNSINLINIVNGEKFVSYNNQKFKFKKTQKGIKFGNEGTFKNFELQNKVVDYNNQEVFHFINNNKTGNFIYQKGNFNFTMTTLSSITAISGNCSIF